MVGFEGFSGEVVDTMEGRWMTDDLNVLKRVAECSNGLILPKIYCEHYMKDLLASNFDHY